MPVLEEKYDSKGNVVGTRFNPTAKMLEFAVARSAPKNASKTNDELCADIGIAATTVQGWQNKYGSHFSEWLSEALETYSAPIREALHSLGLKKALEGDFNFWKALATHHKAVDPDRIDINVLPARVKRLEEMTKEELAEYQQRLLADSRGDEVNADVVEINRSQA
jgi:hypothetical protein